MANTTWNLADKSTVITLSGLNLVATANTASASGGVRTIASLTGVKLYFEITLTSLGGGGLYSGIASATASVITAPGGAGTVTVASTSGNILVGGAASGVSLAAFSAGQIVCAAADLIGNLVWFRKGAAGLWNNNAANNPATGVGGISISSIFGATPAFGYSAFQVVANGTSLSANFGDSAFTGVVPSGFLAGFPTVAPPVTTAQARAMILA
jgi:hypothetical protein